jgi:hypothetical protein
MHSYKQKYAGFIHLPHTAGFLEHRSFWFSSWTTGFFAPSQVLGIPKLQHQRSFENK